MTSKLKRIFFKRNSKHNERVYDTSDYDDSFVTVKKVLGWVAIRMTHDISKRTTKWWDTMYWFEMMNLVLGSISEMAGIVTTIYFAQTFADSIKLFRMMPCFGCVVLSFFKCNKMLIQRDVYENLVHELRTMWPQGEVSEEEHRIIGGALKQLNFIVKGFVANTFLWTEYFYDEQAGFEAPDEYSRASGYYWCNNALLISFMSPPFLLTIARYFGYESPMTLHFFYWLPFDPCQPVVYEIMLVVQTWHGLMVIWMNVSWDILFCTYLCHITTQFDLLARRVRRLFYVKVDQQLIRSYPMANISEEILSNDGEGVEEDARHQREIANIVIRHHALIRMAGDVENMFSLPLLINFMNSSIIICFCGFCCVAVESWNEVAYKSFLVTALTQTWLLCWYGQKLIDSSQGLAMALYECGWYNSSKRSRSAVLIMLHRAQKAVCVTTYGFSVISLSSYSTIIRTAWSYFTLLLNFFFKES